MNATQSFKLSGLALASDAAKMLDEICEHFFEHAEVRSEGNLALLTSRI